ncbi:MAG: Alanine--tRNA ligase [Pleopsidium flavum]|nr:MAG: Alanine--tRNA ligase [Pleopsidium flavum]
MQHGPDKEQEVKTTQIDLNQLTISAITKSKLRDRFAKIHKQVLDEQKAQQKAESKKALDTITEYFARPENKHKTTLVTKLPISANSKAVSEAINHIKSKDKDKTVYLFAADNSEGKVVHGCHVSEEASKKGASATDWANTVSSIVGGKAGGKAPTSIGNGTNVDKVDEAVEVAGKYLEGFHL